MAKPRAIVPSSQPPAQPESKLHISNEAYNADLSCFDVEWTMNWDGSTLEQHLEKLTQMRASIWDKSDSTSNDINWLPLLDRRYRLELVVSALRNISECQVDGDKIRRSQIGDLAMTLSDKFREYELRWTRSKRRGMSKEAVEEDLSKLAMAERDFKDAWEGFWEYHDTQQMGRADKIPEHETQDYGPHTLSGAEGGCTADGDGNSQQDDRKLDDGSQPRCKGASDDRAAESDTDCEFDASEWDYGAKINDVERVFRLAGH